MIPRAVKFLVGSSTAISQDFLLTRSTLTAGLTHAAASPYCDAVIQRIALSFIALASPILAIAFLLGEGVPAVVAGALVVLSPVAVLLVALSRGARGLGGSGPYLIALALLLVVAALGTILSGPAPVFLGLPAGALWMLGGLWLGPLLLLGWAYPSTFAAAMLDGEDLRRIRQKVETERESSDKG